MCFIFSRKALRKLWGDVFSKKTAMPPKKSMEVAPVQNTAGNEDNTLGAATAISAATIRRNSIHGGASTQLVLPASVAPGLSATHANHLQITNAGDRAGEVEPTRPELRETIVQQMFGDNVLVQGGEFLIGKTVIVNEKERAAFELLLEHVAPAAFHNSAERVDPPRCHLGTRVEVLNKIYDWIIQSKQRKKWLMWLNGAAGAGKSAIMQSIAERCFQAGIAIATFFFFRSGPTRNTMAPLIATLAYQLMQIIPETKVDILLTIESNPLVFAQSLEVQLQCLIIQPLSRLPTYLQRLFVVLIDGLDECNDHDNQSNLISIFSKISSGKNIPVVFLIASRREHQIEAVFVAKQVSDLLVTLPLDNSDIEKTSDDIRHFVNDKFNDIKETHLSKAYLPADWPPLSAGEEIIAKSSGQFIYAAVVMNFISSPYAHPAHQLDVIKGIRPRNHAENPFAQLDALYQYIFSQVKYLDIVRNILAYTLLGYRKIHDIKPTFQLESGELEVYFADLSAVIECEPRTSHTKDQAELKFLHASLPDFLLDKSRSEEHYIDLDEYHKKLLCMFFERLPPLLDPLSPTQNLDAVSEQEYWRLFAIEEFLKTAKASDQLRKACMSFNFIFHNTKMANDNSYRFPELLDYFKQLDFNDQGEAYHHVVEVFAIEYAKYWPLEDDQVMKWVITSDIFARIGQIRQEEL